jgi:hypothetical protein
LSPSPQNSDTFADHSISLIITLITNTDPSPKLFSALITPIIVPLYSLLHHLDGVKTSDPTLKELILNLLSTWARVISVDECIEELMGILSSERIGWRVGLDGSVQRQSQPNEARSLSLFTPEDLDKAEKSGGLDSDSNFLGLYPDPKHFVLLLEALDQQEIFGAVFAKVLAAYWDSRQMDGNNPEKCVLCHAYTSQADSSRSLLYLQLIMQMQARLSDSKASGNMLKKPEQILTFIKHTLNAARMKPVILDDPDLHDDLEKLRLNRGPNIIDLTDEADSDDEMSDSEAFTTDDEMTETSVSLLLSILEGYSFLFMCY